MSRKKIALLIALVFSLTGTYIQFCEVIKAYNDYHSLSNFLTVHKNTINNTPAFKVFENEKLDSIKTLKEYKKEIFEKELFFLNLLIINSFLVIMLLLVAHLNG